MNKQATNAVTRYSRSYDGMARNQYGDWVNYQDYERLRALLAMTADEQLATWAEQAFHRWVNTLPKPVQENIRGGLMHGRSFSKEAFLAGWFAAWEQARPYDLRA